MTSEAERRLRDEVARLTGARDALRTEIDTLVSLLNAERESLTESLTAALGYVERSLVPSSALTAHQTPKAPAEGATDSGRGKSSGKAAPSGEAAGDGGDTKAHEAAKPREGAKAHEGTKPHEGAKPHEGTKAHEGGKAEADAVSERVPTETKGSTSTSEDEEEDEVDEDEGDGIDDVKDVDDLEAGIAEDAAAAAPAPPVVGARSSDRVTARSEQYDWDSVIRGQTEPLFGNRPHTERPNLQAVPPLDDTMHDTAALQLHPGRDWPA